MPQPYYTPAVLEQAARYWDEKDAASVKLDKDRLRAMLENYLSANNTCALATGTGGYVRCTPIEYSWHDGCFWMFSEGGKKFVGLAENPNVCLAIYDKYEGFGKLHGVQVMGKAELIEPFSQVYLDHAAYKKDLAGFSAKPQKPDAPDLRPADADRLPVFRFQGIGLRAPADAGAGARLKNAEHQLRIYLCQQLPV